MEIRELTKRYDGRAVVDGVSFGIPRGKVTSFIGPNGAGKSTVMGMISRLIARDAGEVDFSGRDLKQWKSKELSRRLAACGKDEAWLQNTLRSRHFSSPREVFLMTLDERGTILCIPKEDTP